MLAVACAGMLVYAVAGAAPDGRQLAPAACSSDSAGPPAPGCVDAAAKGSDKDKGSTPDKCEPTTTTTEKGGGKPTTSTTEKGGDKPTTSTTEKDGDKPTTSTTEKGGDKPTTSTTEKGGDKPTTSTTEKGDKGSTTTTGKGDGGKDSGAASTKSVDSHDLELNAAAAAKGDDKATKAADDTKEEKAAADKAGADKPGKPADDTDCSTTTTTEKGGKGDDGGKDTTTTTRKKGDKDPTTTTTEKDKGDKPTTTTTAQRGPVDSPPPGDGGSGTPGGSADPGDTPITPQEAPPYDAPDSDPGPAEDPEAAADPGPVNGFDMWDDDEVAVDPLEAPGSGSMLPVIDEIAAPPAQKARRERSRTTGSSGRRLEVASAPVVATPRPSSAVTPSSPAVTESAAVSRRLAGLQTSATESAFPASIISTPSEFPVNHRDPLAAAALVILLGVSRELFKVWRRRATDYWPA